MSHKINFFLNIHRSYDGPNDIIIGDDLGLHITRTSTATLPKSLNLFSLSNVLYVPFI